jgi:hypothetical protein
MMRAVLLLGALLGAAPLFSQIPPAADPQRRDGELRWFLLTETKDEVTRALGPPTVVAGFGQDFVSWQYQIGDVDHDEFSHQVVFRSSVRGIVSITRNYQPERNVDELFPETETTVHHYPDAEKPQFSLRLRCLPAGRVLMAMGISRPGQLTGQLVLMKESELRYFYPWVAKQLRSQSP